MRTENLSTLKIHKLSKSQYERELNAGNIDENALYLTPDEETDLSIYALKEDLDDKANVTHTHNEYVTNDYVNENFLSKSDVGDIDLSDYETKTDSELKFDQAKAYTDFVSSEKANKVHNHDDLYYTEAEIDAKLSDKSDKTHNHNNDYDSKGSSTLALDYAKSYTDTKVSGLASTSSVDTKISSHNISTSAHDDIRDLISGLTTRLNALADSDDTTLDQLSEIVAYIKSNKSLIDSITTSKVNVSDIINNLTTNVTNKPLSAAQGVALKGLIDALQTVVDGKQNTITGGASSITSNNLSTWKALISDANGKVTTSVTTSTELDYLSGVTSAIQTQLNEKYSKYGGNVSGNILTVHPSGGETSVGAHYGSDGSTIKRLYIYGNNSSGVRGIYDTKKGNIATVTDTTTTFMGTLSGNASSATQVYSTATNPTTGITYYVPFHDANSTSGNKSLRTNEGIRYYTRDGSTSNVGTASLGLGNNIAAGASGNKRGSIYFYGNGGGYTELFPSNNTANNININLPSTGGTLSLDGHTHSQYLPSWNNSQVHRYSFGGAQDLAWKKVCEISDVTTAPTYATYHGCTIYGKIHHQLGNHYQAQVRTWDFMATFLTLSNTSVSNTATLYLPPTLKSAGADIIRIVRVSTNSWELQVRQPVDWQTIVVEFCIANNSLQKVEPCSPITATNTKTVIQDYNTHSVLTAQNYALASHSHSYVPLSGGTMTGTLVINKNTDANQTSATSPALIVGGTESTAHIAIDANEIIAKKNGTSSDILWLNGVTQVTTDGSIIAPNVTAKDFVANTTAMSISGGKLSNLSTGTSKLFKDGLAISNPTTANDVGWIRVTGTGESDTVLEIATGDDGGAGESIVARQYNTSNAVARQAVLLGTNGKTSFPVSVTAPSFIGSLSGDASSAHILNVNNVESKSVGRLQFFQTSSNSTLLPNTDWWSLVRTQHAGYANGYWQEMAYCFHSDDIKYRRNTNGKLTAWRTIAFTDHTHSYLPLSGGTLTGNVSYTMHSSTQVPFKVYGGDANGQGISVGAGGATIVGAGESAKWLESQVAATTEELHLSSDGKIVFWSNCQNGSATDAKTVYLDANRYFYPAANNSGSIGTSGNKWASMYATTFYGALSGNASTATKATQDASGNVITSTYATKTELNGKANASHGTHVSYGGNGSATTVSRSDHSHSSITTQAITNWNGSTTNGFYQGNGASNAPSSSGWYWGFRMQHSGGYGAQIAIGNGTNTMHFRSQGSDGSGTWRNVLHSGNYSSYALPISGGKVTGQILCNYSGVGGVTIEGSGTTTGIQITRTDTKYGVRLGVSSSGAVGCWFCDYNKSDTSSIFYRKPDDANATTYLPGRLVMAGSYGTGNPPSTGTLVNGMIYFKIIS